MFAIGFFSVIAVYLLVGYIWMRFTSLDFSREKDSTLVWCHIFWLFVLCAVLAGEVAARKPSDPKHRIKRFYGIKD